MPTAYSVGHIGDWIAVGQVSIRSGPLTVQAIPSDDVGAEVATCFGSLQGVIRRPPLQPFG